MKRLIALLFCVILAIAAFGCTDKEEAELKSEEMTPLSGEPMDTYETEVGDLSFDTTTLDGRSIRAGVIREYDLIMINCWADWCGPCVEEIPEIERMHKEHPNVLVLGLLCNPSSVGDSKTILKDAGVTYAALEPSGSLVSLMNGTQAFPTTYFFDSTGRQIGEPVVGKRSYAEWNAIVKELLP